MKDRTQAHCCGVNSLYYPMKDNTGLYHGQAGTHIRWSAQLLRLSVVFVVVRTRSPIDWYHYTAYNLAVNPGDDYVFAEREVYRDRLSNLVRCMDPRSLYCSVASPNRHSHHSGLRFMSWLFFARFIQLAITSIILHSIIGLSREKIQKKYFAVNR